MAAPVEWLNEFQVNTGTADVAGISDPQVVGLAGGNYLVAWVEAGTTGVGTTAGNDIIGKIFDAEGNVVRDSFRINTFGNVDDEDDFDIAATNDGGFSMVYVDDDISNSNQEAILYQRYDDNGDSVGGTSKTIVSNTVATEVVSNPKIVVNNNDNSAYITFTDNVGGGSGNDEIRAVRVDASGAVITAEFDAGANTTGQFSRDAEAAINTNGELVTVYEEDDGGFAGIELMIRNTAGVQQHNVNVVTGSATVTASDPHVATLANGNIVVTWTEGNDVKYRVFDSNAVPDPVGGGPFNVDTSSDIYNESHVTALPQGGFVITWDNDTANTLQARAFNSDGSVSGTDTVFTLEPAAGTEVNPNVAALADGRILFSWEEGDNVISSIWDNRGANINASTYDGLPLNFVETSVTTTNVIDTTLTGDSDADTILGQGGDDSITGGSAADSIDGGGGNDTINGGLFVDTVNGGSGDDSIIIGAGNAADVVNGGSGTDTLDFSASSLTGDIIFTGSTSGTYIAGLAFSGIDEIKAGSASTTIDLFFGTQTVDGGGGNDLFIHGDGEFIDNLAGGAGDDTLDLSAAVGAGEEVNIDQAAGTWSGLNSGVTIAGFEHIIGTQEDDTIDGGNTTRTIDGQGGDDILDIGGTASFENVTVMGGSGNDTIFANNSAFETLQGGSGVDTINTTKFNGNYNINLINGLTNFAGESFTQFESAVTGNGNDTVFGTSAANNIATNGGDDLIIGGAGADTIDGGTNTAVGDTASYSNSNGAVSINLGSGFANGAHATGDVLTNIENLFGSAFGDVLTGTTGNNVINGFSGNDTINGGSGDDSMEGGQGNDFFISGLGADTINGGAGAGDTASYAGSNAAVTIGINAGAVNSGGHAAGDVISTITENLIGSSFGDNITGNTLANNLSGLNGNDTIIASNGNDTVSGGGGDDLLNGGRGADVINGGSGTDTASYTNTDNVVIVNLAAGTTIGSGHGAGDTLISIENVIGGQFDDTITGNSGNNDLNGFLGDDQLNGAGGDDNLLGSTGDDTLNGGTGNDVMTGSGGTDTFEFDTAAFGKDTIIGFANGLELLDFSASGLAFSDLNIITGAFDTVVELIADTNNNITLVGVTGTIDSSDFLF